MRDVLTQIMRWWAAGEKFGLATVVHTFHSAPRPPGASMAVLREEAVGSVSGGCVEGAVYELAREVTGTGEPVLQRYGVSDDDAFTVGLTCGGIIDILVEPVSKDTFPELGEIAASMAAREPVAIATVLPAHAPTGPGAAVGPGLPAGGAAPGGPDISPPRDSTSGASARGGVRVGARRVVWPDRASGSLGVRRLDDAVDDDVRGMLAQGQTGVRRYGPRGERRMDDLTVFVHSFAPPPRLLVFGAIDFAAAVARLGKFLGYHVVVCDARPVFATPKRFPEADEVVVRWPHDYLTSTPVDERTAIAVLTHDPKFDVPLLEVALRGPAGYVGAMGSRRTHEDRLTRLREAGLTDAELDRLRSPIGLDLGARTPEETAVAIAAELIQLRWGGSGRPLTDTSGRIHGEP